MGSGVLGEPGAMAQPMTRMYSFAEYGVLVTAMPSIESMAARHWATVTSGPRIALILSRIGNVALSVVRGSPDG